MAKASSTHGRLTKEELKHDTLVETAVKVEGYFTEHRNTVYMIGGGILGVVVLILGLNLWMGSSAQSESYDLTQAKTMYGQRRLAEAQTQFQAVQSAHGGATAAEAQYYLSRIKFDQGDFSGAMSGFESCLKDYSADDETAQGALAGIAASAEALGRLDDAAAKYVEAAEKYPDTAYSPEAYNQAARVYLKLNQKDKALAMYDQIIAKYPDSQLFGRAKTQAGLLR